MKIVSQSGKTVVDCETALNCAEFLNYQQSLQEAISLNKKIIVETKDVSAVDTITMQLLLSFYLTAKKNNLNCEWSSVSPSMLKTATLLGMKKILNLPG